MRRQKLLFPDALQDRNWKSIEFFFKTWCFFNSFPGGNFRVILPHWKGIKVSRCFKVIPENGHQGFARWKGAGRFLRHHNLNDLMRRKISRYRRFWSPPAYRALTERVPTESLVFRDAKAISLFRTCTDLLVTDTLRTSNANPATTVEDSEDLK